MDRTSSLQNENPPSGGSTSTTTTDTLLVLRCKELEDALRHKEDLIQEKDHMIRQLLLLVPQLQAAQLTNLLGVSSLSSATSTCASVEVTGPTTSSSSKAMDPKRGVAPSSVSWAQTVGQHKIGLQPSGNTTHQSSLSVAVEPQRHEPKNKQSMASVPTLPGGEEKSSAVKTHHADPQQHHQQQTPQRGGRGGKRGRGG